MFVIFFRMILEISVAGTNVTRIFRRWPCPSPISWRDFVMFFWPHYKNSCVLVYLSNVTKQTYVTYSWAFDVKCQSSYLQIVRTTWVLSHQWSLHASLITCHWDGNTIPTFVDDPRTCVSPQVQLTTTLETTDKTEKWTYPVRRCWERCYLAKRSLALWTSFATKSRKLQGARTFFEVDKSYTVRNGSFFHRHWDMWIDIKQKWFNNAYITHPYSFYWALLERSWINLFYGLLIIYSIPNQLIQLHP